MLPKDKYQSYSLHKRVSECVEDFAPLPAVAMKVMEMVSDPDTMATDLESVIEGDISLVAAVLRLANSAFYGLRRKVESLRHALILLGKAEVQSLVLSRVMFQTFKAPSGKQKELMVGVWSHSLECALAAECIAERCGDESSLYFLGGMLHDIGRLVIFQKFLSEIENLERYGQLMDDSGLNIENEFLGCGHNEIGSQLLHRWMFPSQLVDMVEHHHSYDEIATCERSTQIMILADLLSRKVILGGLPGNPEGSDKAMNDLLLKCGVESSIIPDEESLLELEAFFKQRLEDRSELLEMLQM